MNHAILRQRLVLASALLLAGVVASCTTVVKPISTDDSHGLVVGDIRLTGHGPDRPNGREQALDMNLFLEEGTQRTRFVLTDLPTASPFVAKLPVGSYRVNGIRISGLGGVWHTAELPTNFQVHAAGCTSLGIWELQRETDSLADWITGHVLKEPEPTHVELQQVFAIRECPTLAESSVRSKLAFQNRLYPWP